MTKKSAPATSATTQKRATPAKSEKPQSGKVAKSPDVFALLRERIVSHEIAPGSRLREQELADEYGAPRAKVREALMALQERGLVERIPNRGAIVVKLDLDQVFEIYQVREVLEGLTARLATENTDPASWQDLVELFDGPMQEHVEKGDYEAFVAGYALFRRRIIEAAANPVLTAMIDSIYEKTQVLIRRIIVLPGRGEQGLKEHRAVLAAMRRGDAEEAERCRRENMRSAREFITRYKNFIF
ncbi:MAG: GntR family transcriptional regulator [Pandoraea sp.]|nr:MAG: GntR family transcriptional regulator [Pandoraea sp.]TAM18116.1 MAG: GntR family transcriptional regulator [Pandoraea sp.]